MNFKNWLLNESKAITLPPEVLSFIDQITPEITKIMIDSKKNPDGLLYQCSEIKKLNKKWHIKVPIKSKSYDRFDYEITGVKDRKTEKYFPITVVLDCNYKTNFGQFSDNEVKVNTFWWGKLQDGSTKLEISIESVKGLLIHEFIHAVDIKNHDEKVIKAISKKHSDGDYSDPNEIDAYSGTITQRIISYANESNDHQKTHKDLEKILDFIKSTEKYRNTNIVLYPLIPKDVVKIYKYMDIGDETIKRRMLSRIYDAVMQAKTIIQQKQRI